MNWYYFEISLSARRDSDEACMAEIGGFFCCSSFLTRKKKCKHQHMFGNATYENTTECGCVLKKSTYIGIVL